MPNLDRFPDAPEQPLDMVARCACGCGEAIHFGDFGVYEYDGDFFASAECFAKWSGARQMDFEWA